MKTLTQANRNKYGAKKTEIDGIRFDSRHEAERYIELRYMERAHLISDLELQRTFTLIGPQKDKAGKIIEHPVKYVADFVYKDADGQTVVEDTKSPATRTPAYVIKRKLMLSIYGLRIKEV